MMRALLGADESTPPHTFQASSGPGDHVDRASPEASLACCVGPAEHLPPEWRALVVLTVIREGHRVPVGQVTSTSSSVAVQHVPKAG